MENKDKLTVLVTGFGPFGPYETNPSWEAVKLLPDFFKTTKESSNVNLVVVEVPVSYDHVTSKIKELYKTYTPSIILNVGVSAAATCLTIEKHACSKGYFKPDVFNQCPKEYDVDHVVLKSNCETQEVCKIINECSDEINCKAKISNDAGRYLCEYIYYQSLALGAPQVLFVHVPEERVYTSEQTAQGLLKIILYLIECVTNAVKK
ncbi:pyroglutamyl-peptidase 1 [Copidosoma floridanum]|uniref:pyroglutamyl-peptidase 1 n=1 Tax=Copidosoma floridanum TaxID=29053 RepID=UPI0006C9A29E|nr:pyroglutamyl-peptidase 1 [Copidosoma floridanum]